MKKIYITPRVECIPVEISLPINGTYTEDSSTAPEFSDGELDANTTTFEPIDLWDNTEEKK